MSEKTEGYVEHIIYHNEENGYTVFELSAGGGLVCVGKLFSINEGEYLELTGTYVTHRVYGEQFNIESYNVRIPQDSKALERYLGSGAVKGIGPALAARILKHFGEDTLRIINEEPERLAEIKGISERKARDIAYQMEEKSQLQNDMIFLSGYGISLNLSLKIHQQYHEDLYKVMRENPYRLAEDISGVGFRIADSIAMNAGIKKDSPFRIQCGICHVLSEALSEGSVYLPREELLHKTSGLLEIDLENLESNLMDLMIDKKIVVKGDFVYLSRAYYTELSCARMLMDINVVCDGDDLKIKESVKKVLKNEKLEPDEMQVKAVETAAVNGLTILTGGPGTGKTTAINMIIRYFESRGMTILLAAPTGRAAKRMTETSGHEASTIHRLLEIYGNPEDDREHTRFARNRENPLEADVIIIDEASMVDIFLMYSLLDAIVPGTRLVMVGDMNQLPSVGAGRVLRDMILSAAFPVIRLEHIFRQAAMSDIVMNAHKINEGIHLTLDNESKDFFFMGRDDVRVIQRLILSLVAEKLPPYVGAESADIQVISPMRKGALGVENLNAIMQKYLNRADGVKQECETGNGIFREGDKVMQIRNDYQMEWEIRGKFDIPVERGTGVFNGDMGTITKIDNYLETVTVEFEEKRMVDYSFKELDELELAYAVTVHKSQGSEYPAVIMPVAGGPRLLLTRNLLYTAVTRAKKCVVLIGSRDCVSEMIDNQTEEKRYTTLSEKITEIQNEESFM